VAVADAGKLTIYCRSSVADLRHLRVYLPVLVSYRDRL